MMCHIRHSVFEVDHSLIGIKFLHVCNKYVFFLTWNVQGLCEEKKLSSTLICNIFIDRKCLIGLD